MGDIERNVDLNRLVCEASVCTACGACENICPKHCIKRVENDSSFQMLKGVDCVDCGLCETVCPSKNDMVLNFPMQAYAAWSKNNEERHSSASGGIASSIYRYAIDNHCEFIGAYMTPEFECHLRIGNNDSDRKMFQNSKYTYSFPDDIYKQVAERLKGNKRVIFIGLPCQVAAMRSYVVALRVPSDTLILVDIICHGTPMPSYLKEHIDTIAKKNTKKPEKCFFRDTKFGTPNYVYTLYTHNSDEPFYRKKVDEDDLYQIGYHGALIYRDSCYKCRFAQSSRAGDITIGDFHVFDVASCDIDINNVSTILVNTEAGRNLIRELNNRDYINIKERELDEPIRGEKQLRHPSIAGPERKIFLDAYSEKKNYDIAAEIAFKKIVCRNKLHIDKIKISIKKCIRFFIPQKIWITLKMKLKGNR